ncbi:uncharacterized protein LOC125586234 [Brassica napus]|uniref:Reverse transcriptase zinc-binding domain-containing protein n=2 Tax=Brassica oleracea TaxID=3712 RepID=A0A0D3C5I3_BRAOL|nr:PREDICTED: uncharacterized protein LOC106339188 [Brassica oleracea var. oleracea]XP_048612050.1 uncharacterized protein LOC125586234 [Brassica napus]VDD15837.1 unnamed protein product [Brassica oleracea]
MGRLGEAVSSQTSVFLGCAGHQCGFMGVEEVTQTETFGENLPASCRDPGIHLLVDQIKAFPIVLSTDTEDAALWKKDVNEFQKVFTAHNTWNLIRMQKVVQPWSRIVWFPQNVPRFAFVAWLAIKDRLAMRHRLSSWGQGLACGCVFCGGPDEIRDHLFFACPYTFTLWIDVVGSLMGTSPDPDWYITLEQLDHRSHDRLTTILLRLAYQVTIYYIWRERNERKHNNIAKPVRQLARIVDKTIRSRIMSTRYYKKPKLRGLLQRWFTIRLSTA